MISIRLEPCCRKCHFPNIYVDTNDLYTGEGLYDVDTVIRCSNERICKFREESSGPIEPMKWGDDEYQGPKRLV